MRRLLFSYFLLLISSGRHLAASSIEADTVQAGNLVGQSKGIALSSHVFFAIGSSLTLQGSTGYITNASSITASSFFGDGQNLTGIAGLAATQTFSGANAFVSSFTVQSGGRQIVLSTSATANNLAISSTGVVAFFPELHNSSSTIVPPAATTNDNFGPCVAGSTLTITTTGGRVEVIFTGKLSNDETGASGEILGNAAELNFLHDGNFPGGLSSSKGIVRATGDYATMFAEDVGAFRYLLDAPAAGTHSYCLTIARSQINPGRQAGATHLGGEGSVSNIFFVKEIK